MIQSNKFYFSTCNQYKITERLWSNFCAKSLKISVFLNILSHFPPSFLLFFHVSGVPLLPFLLCLHPLSCSLPSSLSRYECWWKITYISFYRNFVSVLDYSVASTFYWSPLHFYPNWNQCFTITIPALHMLQLPSIL